MQAFLPAMTAPSFLAAISISLAAPSPASAVWPLDLSDLGGPPFTTFSTLEGAPEAVVNSVVVDRLGFARLASPLGLRADDGQRWSMVEDLEAAGSVLNLLIDSQGALWVTSIAGFPTSTAGGTAMSSPTDRRPTTASTGWSKPPTPAGRPELWAVLA
jgi:hypothetical protein